MAEYPYFMSVDEAVSFSGLTKETIYDAILSDDLKFVLINNRVRITQIAFSDFFDALRAKQRAPITGLGRLAMEAVYIERVFDALAVIANRRMLHSESELRDKFIADVLSKPLSGSMLFAEGYKDPEDQADEIYAAWLQKIANGRAKKGQGETDAE